MFIKGKWWVIWVLESLFALLGIGTIICFFTLVVPSIYNLFTHQPSNAELSQLHDKYVITKQVPVKYIKYSKSEYFLIWNEKSDYIKVFYPKNKTEEYQLSTIDTEYKIPTKKYKSGTTRLLYSYEDYKENTPESVKTKLDNTKYQPKKQSRLSFNVGTNIKFIIYKKAEE